MNDSKAKLNDERSAGNETTESAPPAASRWGLLNWLLLSVGAALLLAGFFLLSKADAWAENAAAAVSPFCILSGYALLFISLIVRPAK